MGGGPKPTPLKKQKNKTKLIIGTPTPRTDVRHLASINRKTLDDSVVYLCQHSMSIYMYHHSIGLLSFYTKNQQNLTRAAVRITSYWVCWTSVAAVSSVHRRGVVTRARSGPRATPASYWAVSPASPTAPTAMHWNQKSILYLCIQLSMTDRVI